MHRVTRLVSKGGKVAVHTRVVKKNVGLGRGASCAECAAALTLRGIYVYPSAVKKTVAQHAVIFLTEHLNGAKHLLDSLLILVLLIKGSNVRGINVVKMKLLYAEKLALEIILFVEGGERVIYCLNEAVIDNGSNLILKRRCGDRVFKGAGCGVSTLFLNVGVIHRRKGVTKLLVGLIEALEHSAADTSVFATKKRYISGVCNLYKLAVITANLAKT